MMRVVVLAGLLAACGGRDQREACTKAARSAALGDESSWIDRCVREVWSDRKIDCMLRSGAGSMGSMFCED